VIARLLWAGNVEVRRPTSGKVCALLTAACGVPAVQQPYRPFGTLELARRALRDKGCGDVRQDEREAGGRQGDRGIAARPRHAVDLRIAEGKDGLIPRMQPGGSDRSI